MIDAILALVADFLLSSQHLTATADVTRRTKGYAEAEATYACLEQLSCEAAGMHPRWGASSSLRGCTEEDTGWTCSVSCSIDCQLEQPSKE